MVARYLKFHRVFWFGACAMLCSLAYADPVDEFVRSKMAEQKIPGVCLAIIGPNGAPDFRSYGVSNLELQTPFTPDSVFRIASLTKQFTAYAVLTLQKEGKLSIEDSIRKFVPDLPAEWEKIKLKHILAHRSGIADPGNLFSYRLEYTNAEYTRVLAAKPLAEEPGTKFRYNNHAYALLAMVVQRASGQDLPSVVKTNIFRPVGMNDTRYWSLDEIIPNRVDGYLIEDGKHINPLMIRPTVFHGSGGILSTMRDMAKYETALRRQYVLDPAILKFQWTSYEGENGYGAGWYVSHPGGKLRLQHTGTTFGFTSCFTREVEAKRTIILFRNCDNGEASDWVRDMWPLAFPD